MKRLAVLLLTLLQLAAVPTPAVAATDTTTRGTVLVHDGRCGDPCELFNFGGYRWRGTTTPSLAGQIVRFNYRRAGTTEWKPFKVADPDEGATEPGFNVQNRSRPRDRINDEGRWFTLFTPNVRPGQWQLRVVFPAQDGYERSRAIQDVIVRAAD